MNLPAIPARVDKIRRTQHDDCKCRADKIEIDASGRDECEACGKNPAVRLDKV